MNPWRKEGDVGGCRMKQVGKSEYRIQSINGSSAVARYGDVGDMELG